MGWLAFKVIAVVLGGCAVFIFGAPAKENRPTFKDLFNPKNKKDGKK